MHTKRSASLDALVREAAAQIGPVEARLLMLHALDRPAAWLFAHGDTGAEPELADRFAGLVAARRAGTPVAYLTGRRGFWTLDLRVTPDTLVPRPETELLVELALARLAAGTSGLVADLGTGSGAIALALARERPELQVIATDVSQAALQVARLNARDHAIDNVEFRRGSWLVPLSGVRCHLIASNPPYIAEGDPHLDQGDLRFEPATALSSGADGLDAVREIVEHAGGHLLGGGWLLLEHGWQQGTAVRALMSAAGYVSVESVRDIEQRERVTLGRASHRP